MGFQSGWIACVSLLVAGAAVASEDPQKPASSPAAAPVAKKPVAPMVLPVSVEAKLAEKIAKQLIAASPVVDPADIKARDVAAEKLVSCEDLVRAAGDRILWGGFHPDQGYDPQAYRLTDISQASLFQLTEMEPRVWAKLYLSTFMFPGTYEIRKEGRLTVLELDTEFRTDLPPGEYPYPFWHSPNKWTAYVKVEKLLLIFEPGRLIAAMRKSPRPESIEQIRRPWDTQWLWTDEEGNPQPRVALYDYLFSKENPHVEGLEKSYRELEAEFRAQNCMQCHEPDNRSRLNDLLLLNYPNQALIMRRNLVTVLEENLMPPGNVIAHEPTGIQDDKVLAHLIVLAKDFERKADEAFAYEKTHATEHAAEQPGEPVGGRTN